MSESTKSTGLESHLKTLRKNLEKSVSELLEQAKKADVHLSEIREKIANIDTNEAKAKFQKIRSSGMLEINRLKEVFQGELHRLSQEVRKSSSKLKTESVKARTKAKSTLKTVKTQVKNITELERNKRRGRSRPE